MKNRSRQIWTFMYVLFCDVFRKMKCTYIYIYIYVYKILPIFSQRPKWAFIKAFLLTVYVKVSPWRVSWHSPNGLELRCFLQEWIAQNWFGVRVKDGKRSFCNLLSCEGLRGNSSSPVEFGSWGFSTLSLRMTSLLWCASTDGELKSKRRKKKRRYASKHTL